MNLIVSVYNLFYISQSYPFTSKYVSEYNLYWVSHNQLFGISQSLINK